MINDSSNQTLETLENKFWGEAPFSSHLVEATYALRKKPLNEFSVEDFRIMIGQNKSLPLLLPLALQILETNLFAEGNYYEGDLLQAVLNVDPIFWDSNAELRARAEALLVNKGEELKSRGIKTEKFDAGSRDTK